jgi:hypothetical protein
MARRRRKGRAEVVRPARAAVGPEAPAAAIPIPRGQSAVVAAVCGTLPLLVYLATLCPTVAGGDSGELITVAHLLGVAHPPGYPLYTMVAKLFTWVPIGSVAWRVNLLSALCDSAAAVLLYRATARWTRNSWSGVLAAGAFAFSPLVWPYAVVAEVFAPNNLFTAALLYLSVRHVLSRTSEDSPRSAVRGLLLPSFVVGLGLSNHHTLVLFAVPALLFMLLRQRREALRPRCLLLLAAALLLGLLPYAYLPIAAARGAAVSWGDPSSPGGLLAHLLRQEYGTFRLASPETGAAGDVLPRLLLFWNRLASTTFWLGPLLLLASPLHFRTDAATRPLGGLWAASLVFYLTFFSLLANVRLDVPLHRMIQERFWQQALVVACAFMGLGLAGVSRMMPPRLASLLQPLVALGLPAALVATHWSTIDQRRNTLFRDYGSAVLHSLPREAVLLITSDEAINSVRYVQHVEGERRDVRVVPTGSLLSPWFRDFAARALPGLTLPGRHGNPDLTRPAPGLYSARDLLDANMDGRPVFVLNRVPWLQTLEQAYSLWPYGLVEQALPKGAEPDLEAWVGTAEASLRRFDPSPASRFPETSWERYLAANYWTQYQRFALAVARRAAARSGEAAVQETAVRVFEGLVARHPSPDPIFYKNLGVAYQFLSRTRPQAREPMRRWWRRYLESNPQNDPDLPAIRRLLDEASRPQKAL